MRNLLSGARTLGNRVLRKCFPTEQQRTLDRWFRDRGDLNLRLEYELDDSSTVLDVGGFEGQWASDIFSMYCCKIVVFEPVAAYATGLLRRFAKNPRIVIHQLALGGQDALVPISVDCERSSAFKGGRQTEQMKVVRAADFLSSQGIERAQLMKVNIEGGEYDLLDHFIDTGYIRGVRDLQVQFHDFVPDAPRRMRQIQDRLKETHELTWQYPFVWENWRRKS